MTLKKYVIGIDYGTDSVRAVIVNALNGDEMAATVKEIIGLGGVAKKSPFVMQTLADVLNMPIKVARTEQTCAFGAAMFAAVVAGIYPRVEDAQKAMGKGFEKEYFPNPENTERYAHIYLKYQKIGAFTEEELEHD